MSEYTLQDAINLAWMLRGMPGQPRQGEPPTIEEAITIIITRRRTIGHTWLTGEKALDLLQAAAKCQVEQDTMKTFTLSVQFHVPENTSSKVLQNPKAYTNALFRVLSRRIKQNGFSVTEPVLAEIEERDPDHDYFVSAAQQSYTREGEIEVDANAIVSSSENGAYVQAWVWVWRPAKTKRS